MRMENSKLYISDPFLTPFWDIAGTEYHIYRQR